MLTKMSMKKMFLILEKGHEEIPEADNLNEPPREAPPEAEEDAANRPIAE